MRIFCHKGLITAAVLLVTVFVTIGSAEYLDRLMPQGSLAWIVLIEVIAVGGMLGASWICDEVEARFSNQVPSDPIAPQPPEQNGRAAESWEFDPLNELRAVVYRAKLRPTVPASQRRFRIRARHGQ